MRLEKIPITLALAFSLALTSCRPQGCPYADIGKTEKEFLVFQPGSWFVYQNDSTLNTDTLFVNDISTSWQGCYESSFGVFEGTNYESFELSCSINDRQLNQYIRVFEVICKFPNPADSTFSFPIFSTAYFRFPSPISNPETITLNGKTYKDVITIDFSSAYQPKPYLLKLARHFGRIAFLNTQTGESWSLVDSHVIQL